MKALIHRIILKVVDTEQYGAKEITTMLGNTRYIFPEVISIETKQVDWDDTHPMNKEQLLEQFNEAFDKL